VSSRSRSESLCCRDQRGHATVRCGRGRSTRGIVLQSPGLETNGVVLNVRMMDECNKKLVVLSHVVMNEPRQDRGTSGCLHRGRCDTYKARSRGTTQYTHWASWRLRFQRRNTLWQWDEGRAATGVSCGWWSGSGTRAPSCACAHWTGWSWKRTRMPLRMSLRTIAGWQGWTGVRGGGGGRRRARRAACRVVGP